MQDEAPIDLFGKKIKKRKTRNQIVLEKYDRETLDERIERLKWVQKIFPNRSGFLMSVETSFIFNEAKMAFINGEFVATLLLVNSFVEHWLGSYVAGKGFHKEANAGLAAIIDCLRKNNLAPTFILDKADYIRQIRNPFVHLKPFDHKYNLSKRMQEHQIYHPAYILEKDAKEAMSIMYTVAVTKLDR